MPHAYSIGFESLNNLSNDSIYSTDPQVVVSGSKVYAVWTSFDGATADILFKVSTDGGLTFGSIISLSSNAEAIPLLACDDTNPMECRGYPQLAVSGSSVYVIWQDNDKIDDDGDGLFNEDPSDQIDNDGDGQDGEDPFGGDDEIFFRKTTDDGATFSPSLGSAATNLSNDDNIAAQARIAATGLDVHLVWVGMDPATFDLDIFYSNSTDSGGSFDPPTILSDNVEETLSVLPDLAIADDNVYVVWQEDLDFSFTFDIFFRASTNNGDSFEDIEDLSNNPGFVSQNPQVAAAGDKVFVTWEDNNDLGDFDILFRRSLDNGANFDPNLASVPDDLSLNDGNSDKPQISTNSDGTDTKVYLSWEDDSDGDDDILFLSSTDSGDNFGIQQDLSSNSGASVIPRMDASGDNIYVAWQDDTLGDATDTDIFFRSSPDGGVTFSGLKDLSNDDDGIASFQQASAGSVYVIWRDVDVTDPTTGEIMFRAGTSSSTDVAFDKSQYKLGDTATISVIAPTGGLLSVDVSSSVDAGFTRELTETGTPGVYTTTITFTTGSSDPGAGILKTKVGGGISADFEGQASIASIFPRTISLGSDIYTLNDGGISLLPVIITVTDQNANTNAATPQSVDILVKSTTDPTGISLRLTETSADSGIFTNTNLIFMTGNALAPVGSSITVSQQALDTEGFTNNGVIDPFSVFVKSSTDEPGFSLILTETNANSGFFTGQLILSPSGTSGGNTILVSNGDILSVAYNGEFTNSLVIPNPDNTVGAIQAAIGDTVTATYLEASDSAAILPGSGGGGGGGGISRAGFVVNFLAGSGGAGGPSAFGTSSFAIIEGGEEGFGGILNDNDANTLEETKTFKVGQKAVLRFDFTEGGGIGNIEHIGLYTNVRDGQKRQDSDAYIYYDPLKSPKLTVHDPNGQFSEVNFDLLQKDATHFALKFDLIFAKPMAKSDLILESWNLKKWSTINKISNAIEVLSSGIVQEQQSPQPVETFLEDVTDDTIIPVWVKSNAKWWSENKIDNDNFISGLEYLVNEGIIKVSLPDTTDNTSISEVQPWIKSTAGWWADGMISEDEFITAIEWLISNNIIEVAA